MPDDDVIRIMPTCIPQSLDDVQTNIRRASAFASGIHLDIDDGVFTPEASWPFNQKQRMQKNEGQKGNTIGELPAFDIPVDNFVIQVHLMVSDGRVIGENVIKAGAESIIIHTESAITPLAAFTDTLGAWSMLGVGEIGIAILLDTPLEKLEPLLPFCDFIHVLSVASIGAQGAAFDARAIDRVREIRARFPAHPISVDGGVSLQNITSLVEAGARRFSIGSAIATAADPARAYADLKTAAESALQ